MNPKMQTTWLDTCPTKLIATILKALREQLKENDQVHSVGENAGPVPEIPLEYDQILKDGGRFWDDVNGGYLPEDLVLAARREQIDWVHSEGVYGIVPMQECKDAGMKPLDLIWVVPDKSVDPTRKRIRSKLRAREYKTKKQGKIRRALPAAQLFSATPPFEAVKVLVSIMVSVSMSNKGKPLKLRHNDVSRSPFQGTAQRRIYIRLPAEDRQKYGEDKVGRLIESMYGTHDASHIWQLGYVNLICGESGGFPRGKHSAALFHIPNQDVRMTVHGDDFVCLSDDDGFKHIDSLLQSLHSERQEAVSTPREKLQDKLVLDGKRSPILKRDEATRYRSACMGHSYLAQDRLDLAETAKHLVQRMSEPREFDFVPLKRAARYLVGQSPKQR